MANKAGALRFGIILVDALPMDVVHENLAVLLFGPTASQIDHQAGMRMTASSRIGPSIGGVRTLGAGIVEVIGDGGNVFVGISVEMLACLPFVSATLDHVKEMRDHARFDQTLPMLVEINSPGITGSLGEHLELFASGMITPDAGIDLRSLRI